ncbi:Fic family protein [Ferrimonas aestuarii]|uniref:Fic family protein n=1 Tax=Ferrimonas aestuarii TaxID=2569539 RepID=UPI00145CC1AC|nr:Fic family protein [Ferrimonas aestuarii]
MYLERIWPETQKSYRCFCPPPLHQQPLAEQRTLSWPHGRSSPLPIPFDYSHFLSRYLAGGVSLKEGRQISRQRLELVEAGLKTEDPLAAAVVDRARRYRQGMALLSTQPITKASLCQAHQLVAFDVECSGQVRKIQNWVGGHSPVDARMVPVPPDQLPAHLEEFIDYICSRSSWSLEQVVAVVTQFIVLHPFHDGNGRVDRLLLEVLLQSWGQFAHGVVNPILYRLSHRHQGFFDQTMALAQGHWQSLFSFWQSAFDWSAAVSSQFDASMGQAHQKLQRKLALRSISPGANALLKTLYQRPLVTIESASKALGLNPMAAHGTIQELVNLDVLVGYPLRVPKGAFVFECREVLEAWQQMDAAVFQTEVATPQPN